MLPHADQEGSRNLTGKEEVVKYLKDAFAHAHKAIGTLTNENLLEQMRDPYVDTGQNTMTLRKSGRPRINRITAGITSYTTVKRLRFTLACP